MERRSKDKKIKGFCLWTPTKPSSDLLIFLNFFPSPLVSLWRLSQSSLGSALPHVPLRLKQAVGAFPSSAT
jgi:hypothetical protein